MWVIGFACDLLLPSSCSPPTTDRHHLASCAPALPLCLACLTTTPTRHSDTHSIFSFLRSPSLYPSLTHTHTTQAPHSPCSRRRRHYPPPLAMEDAREELQRPIGRGIEGLRRRVAAMRAVEEGDARRAAAAAAARQGQAAQQDDHAHQHQHHHHNHDAAAAAPERKKKLGKTIHPGDGAAADGAGALLLEDDEDAVENEEEEEEDGCCTSTSQQGGGKGGKLGAHRRITTEGDVEVEEDDLCCFDWGLLVEPVTLLCGHTFCRHCVGIMLDDSQTKTHGGTPHTPGSMKCPLCCRSLPAVLPQPNVRLRNDLRAKYPGLYEYRSASRRERREGGEGGRVVWVGGKSSGLGSVECTKHTIISQYSLSFPHSLPPSLPPPFPEWRLWVPRSSRRRRSCAARGRRKVRLSDGKGRGGRGEEGGEGGREGEKERESMLV